MTNCNNKIQYYAVWQWQPRLALRNKTRAVSSIRLFNVSSMLCIIMYSQINIISLATCILIVADFASLLRGNIKSNVTGTRRLTPKRNQLCELFSLRSGIHEVAVLLGCEFSSLVIPLLTFGDSVKVSLSGVKYTRNMKKCLLAISILKDEATSFSRNVRDQIPRNVPACLRKELNSTQLRWIRMSSIIEFH